MNNQARCFDTEILTEADAVRDIISISAKARRVMRLKGLLKKIFSLKPRRHDEPLSHTSAIKRSSLESIGFDSQPDSKTGKLCGYDTQNSYGACL